MMKDIRDGFLSAGFAALLAVSSPAPEQQMHLNETHWAYDAVIEGEKHGADEVSGQSSLVAVTRRRENVNWNPIPREVPAGPGPDPIRPEPMRLTYEAQIARARDYFEAEPACFNHIYIQHNQEER
ncbi:MAG: hypothetical protein KKD17_02870 [Nanoarchaeota archaeon]|nr:hypothetical protein [Nanoarchaeota archaeon]